MCLVGTHGKVHLSGHYSMAFDRATNRIIDWVEFDIWVYMHIYNIKYDIMHGFFPLH